MTDLGKEVTNLNDLRLHTVVWTVCKSKLKAVYMQVELMILKSAIV